MMTSALQRQSPAVDCARGNIRPLIILAFVLAAVTPALLINLLTSYVSIRSEIDQTYDQLTSVGTLKAAQIDLWLDGLQGDTRRMTEVPNAVLLVRQSLPDSPQPARRAAAAAELNAQFADFINQGQQFNAIFLMDLTGRIVVSTQENQVGTTYSENVNFANPVVSVVNPRYGAEGSGANLTILHPVLDRGVVIARLGASVPLDQIHPIMIERAGMGAAGETYLVDENRVLITPSRFEGNQIGTTAVQTDGTNLAQDSRAQGVATYQDYRNIDVVGFYEWLPRLGAVMLSERDVGEVLAPVLITILTNIVIAIFAVIAVVVVGLVVVEQHITQPLLELSTAAQEFTKGNVNARVTIRHRDEIGELGENYNEMVESIQKRTHELIRANAIAQESVRLKSQLLSTMPHELRTPLNAILGFTTIMLQGMSGEVDETARHVLERISANGQRLLTLIDDVLNIAKIEAGRLELARERFVPRALAEKLQTQLGGLGEDKGLTFNVVVSDAVPKQLIGDEPRITQILINLISNAFKFTERGGVDLLMDWKDNQWVIKVQDTGIGIPPHAHNLIFEAFRRVDGTSRRVYGGSGLGLAIVRNLCAMMNGQLQVDSKLGEGSTFIITLPLPTISLIDTAIPIRVNP